MGVPRKIVMAKKKEKETEEQIRDRVLSGELFDLQKRVHWGVIPSNPAWVHAVDDKVRFGAHPNTVVLEVYDDLLYKIRSYGTKDVYGKPTYYEQYNMVSWIEIRKIIPHKHTDFAVKNDMEIRFHNTSLDSLLHRIYHSGVNFDPEYQRDLVWDLADKVSLIDSIFNNIEIGKFAFIKRDYSYDIFYEILDGKQRLTALREFYEDRFEYKGCTYSEMSPDDRHHFRNTGVTIGDIAEPKDRKDIYRYFVKLNTAGKPIDQSHLDKIKKLAI